MPISAPPSTPSTPPQDAAAPVQNPSAFPAPTQTQALQTPPEPQAPLKYEVLRATWLSRKPAAESAMVAGAASVALAIGSLLYLATPLQAKMDASGEAVFTHHEYWRLWTTLFAHADAGHLISNLFLFFILGFFLYGYFGARLFPWAALAWGGVVNYISLRSYEPETHLIGASGVVYWMGGVWLVLYFALSRQKNFMHRLVRSIGVALLIFWPAEQFAPEVSYRTHLVGFALGILAGTWHFFVHRRKFQAAERRETIVEEVDRPEPTAFIAHEFY